MTSNWIQLFYFVVICSAASFTTATILDKIAGWLLVRFVTEDWEIGLPAFALSYPVILAASSAVASLIGYHFRFPIAAVPIGIAIGITAKSYFVPPYAYELGQSATEVAYREGFYDNYLADIIRTLAALTWVCTGIFIAWALHNWTSNNDQRFVVGELGILILAVAFFVLIMCPIARQERGWFLTIFPSHQDRRNDNDTGQNPAQPRDT